MTMRESGALQRLVALLESGPTSRITEIAAKTLANLAVADANRTGIRLAGGLPPLLRLLLERPTEQVRVQGLGFRGLDPGLLHPEPLAAG